MEIKFMKRWKPCISFLLALAVVVTSVLPTTLLTANAAEKADTTPYVVSQNRSAYASSSQSGNPASYAVDGEAGTRWESGWGNEYDWIYVDLGKVTEITSIYLNWEAACATKYRIQFSDDEVSWEDALVVTDGTAGERSLAVLGNARYVRVYAEEKPENTKAYGFSLYEFQVYGINGLTPRPVDYGTNLALGKAVTASTVQKEWWMIKKDENGNEIKDEAGNPVYDQSNVLAENAVDGNEAKSWHSTASSDQWLYVDLGGKKEIGRIIISWADDAARVYDVEVSDDAKNWTTIYRELSGYVEKKNLPVYANGRYVRINGIGAYANNGFSIKELYVYEYQTGDEKKTYTIADMPEIKTVQVNENASYSTDDVRFPQAKQPTYLDDSLQTPVASNDWWQSMLIKSLGNALCVLPLKVKNDTNGFGILTLTEGWFTGGDSFVLGDVTSTKAESKIDFYIAPEGMDSSTLYDKVTGYSDYSVTAQLCDASGPLMTNTITKGSPYVFSEFKDKQDVQLYSNNITSLFDDNGKEILTQENVELITDHIGIEITDDDNKAGTKTSKSYYAVNFPEGTSVKRVGSKLKVHFPAANGYLSVGTMTAKSDLHKFYEHGYAFIKDTSVTYDFDEESSVITSYFNVTTEVKREGFSNETFQCLLPHQWKKSTDGLTDMTFSSARGTLKVLEGNSFTTSDIFYGMVPQFTMPQNEEYDNTVLLEYLSKLEQNTRDKEKLPGGDAYWQGKSLHPLALGALVADQIGNTEYRDLFVERLRYIFDDWFTYSGPEDDVHFYYDQNWGTLYYRYSEFGANTGITDHHFTYGYMVFAASVLATYDDDFYNKYKDMIDLIVRDYASPYEDDPMFCRYRSFDLYEGHSWAGGYADNDNGNNQEAAGESLFGWVGQYLWGIRSGNTDFRDSAIFGFTTELNAIKQYWFNYDGDNWPEDYPHKIVGQVYGDSIFYGTFFDGSCTSIYGIHWLPVAEWLTYYGMEQEQLQGMYEGLLEEIESQQNKAYAAGGDAEKSKIKTTQTAWQHIFVPLLSQYDPDQALAEMDPATQDGNEGFNTYWFANSMKDLGVRTYDIYATGGVSASVYKQGSGSEAKYTAVAWNPTDSSMNIQFTDGSKIVGSATIGAKTLVRLDPLAENAVQVGTPEFSLPSDTYDDTQYVKIVTDTPEAKIYYTTDGSYPTNKSAVYTGRIPVSSTTTIKAIAMKDGCINSALQSVTLKINGSVLTKGVNIAKDKKTESSLGDASLMVDANAKTRWTSDTTDTEWCLVDLGTTYTVNKVKMLWEAAYGSQYEIQISTNGTDWTTVYTESAGDGALDEVIFDPVKARYVKMQGVKRATEYGYSIFEFGVYEAAQVTAPKFSLAGGTYEGNQLVSIASGTQAVEIRYTADGSTPTKDSPLYIPRLAVWKSGTIKAVAFKKGMLPSAVSEVTYTINKGTNPGDADNYDETDSFTVEADAEIEEEKLAGESGEVQTDNTRLKSCLSYGKTAYVTSSENANTSQNITDGNLDSVWSSAFDTSVVNRHTESCYIDLGESVSFNEVAIYWGLNTPGNKYSIQVSDDKENWDTVYTYTKATGSGNMDTIRFDTVSARYVKMQGISIGMDWGYVIREMLVYQSTDAQPLGENMAVGAKTTVSSQAEGYPGTNVNDGNTATVWKAADSGSQELLLDLYKTYTVDKVVLKGAESCTASFVIQVSEDNKNWNTVTNAAAGGAGDGVYKFEEEAVRYVKVSFMEGAAEPVALSEVEVYTKGSADIAKEVINYFDRTGAGASSEEDAGKLKENLIDGDSNTAWSSAHTGSEWCYIDLGEVKTVNIVKLLWEAAYAKQYTIDVSTDGDTWETVYTDADGDGGTDEISFPAIDARYIRMSGIERATAYGYSIYEMNAGYRAPINVERMEVSPSSAKLNIGEKIDSVYVVSPSNADDASVKWTSSDTSVAVVDNKGTVTAKGAGRATITVSSVADETKQASYEVAVTGALKAPKAKAVKEADTNITISWNEIVNAAGYDIYRATSSGGTYVKLNTAVITNTSYIDANLKIGKYYYKVMAIAAENDEIYLSSELSASTTGVTISAQVTTIELSAKSGTVRVNETITISAAVYAEGMENKPILWSSADEQIAVVDNGKIIGVKAGKTTITASVSGVEAMYQVTVTDRLGAPVVEAKGTGNFAVLTWEAVANAASYDVYRAASADEAYKKINTAGVMETTYTDENLAAGTYYYKVVAVSQEDIYENSEQSAATTGVKIAGKEEPGENQEENPDENSSENPNENPSKDVQVSKIQLSKEVRVIKGSTTLIKAVVSPKNATNSILKWSSANDSIATVNAGTGQVKGMKYGVTTITAKAADGSGVVATCKVRVGYKITYKLNSGKNSPTNPTSYYKETVKLTNPSKAGYDFKGWYTDQKFKNKITTIKSSAKKNYTLYAKWEKVLVGETSVKTLTSPKKAQIKAAFGKTSGASGYEVTYASDKNFKKNTKVTTSKSSIVLKKIKSGSTCYVKVRAYKIDSAGKKVYGKYAAASKVKVK